MKTIRITATILSAAMAATLLAGCGSNASSSTSNVDSTTSIASSTASTGQKDSDLLVSLS